MFIVEPSTLLTFLAACVAIVIVPGPTVTVIIANSIRSGTGAGLMNVAGTQAGLVLMIAVLALGFETIVGQLGHIFFWIKIAGAGYLIWLGIQLWRSDGRLGEARSVGKPALSPRALFWQGFLVIWSNPKALFFFGAFIPQFIDISAALSPAMQTVYFGLLFMVVATLLDAMYAVLAGSAGKWLTRSNIRIVERVSGTCLIAGGAWLALTKR